MLKIEGNLLWVTSFILGIGLNATSSFAAVIETESQEVAEQGVKTQFHLADISSEGVAKQNPSPEAEAAILDGELNATSWFTAFLETESQEVAEQGDKTNFYSTGISPEDRAKQNPSPEAEAAILDGELNANSSLTSVPKNEFHEVAEQGDKTDFHSTGIFSEGVAKQNPSSEAEAAILDGELNATSSFASVPKNEFQEVAEQGDPTHFHSTDISREDRAKQNSSIEAETAIEQELHSSEKTTLYNSSTNSSPIAQMEQYGSESDSPSSPLPTVDPLSVDASSEPNAMSQVTSVSQLTDVQPTDWAFQALQSLVERYGCIAGYPDRTYRGNRAMTRYEFAAGLNACLDKINQLIAAGTGNFEKKEDLLALEKLQQEFATELATLRGRIDVLEARTTGLEAQQFSTTTKISGEVIFAVANVFGGDDDKNETVLQERAFINFFTSFTGKDRLFVSLGGGNVPITTSAFNLPGVNLGGSLPYPSGEGALTHQVGSSTDNLFYLYYVEYQFPINDRLQVILPLYGGATYYLAPVLNPYITGLDFGSGAISAFGQQSPIYRLGAGTGIGVNYKLTDQLTLNGSYLADGLNANNPTKGAFQSGYTAFGQITWNPSKNFSLGLSYANNYFLPGVFGFNNYGLLQLTGTAVANTLAGQTNQSLISGPEQPVIVNSYGVQFSFQPSPKFAINGWFGASYPRLIGRGDGEILYYALTFAFPDFGKEGNLLGFVVGAEPYLTRFDGGNPQPFKRDIPFHLEAFYQYQLTPNITLTPGVIWLTAPNQDKANEDDVIATLRATFSF